MEKDFSKRLKSSIDSHSVEQRPQTSDANILNNNVEVEVNSDEVEVDENDIVADPGLRKPVDSFNVDM